MIIRVDRVSDPRVADYGNVPDPELLRARGIFIAEGRMVVRRLLDTPRFRTRSLLLTPAGHEAMADALAARPDLPAYVVPQDVMNGITGFNIHRGCLAIGERPSPDSWTDVAGRASLLVVLERVGNADNVGGIFRSADAFGADAVLLGPGCADPLYRKAIRTSMGAALRVPFAAMPEWPNGLEQLRADGFQVIALTPDAAAKPLDDVSPPARIALVVGHEGDGLTADALAAADQRVRIPLARGVDSLNASTAAAIALYALSRRSQRGAGEQRFQRSTSDR